MPIHDCRLGLRMFGAVVVARHTHGPGHRGLGTSPIGNDLRKEGADHTEVGLKARIAEFIAAQVSANGLSRKETESLGMQCAPAPSAECTYSGSLWYRVERLPQDHPRYGKRTIENIDVQFSYLNPKAFVVRVQEHDVREE